MSFWIVEIGDGFCVVRGRPGAPHLLNPQLITTNYTGHRAECAEATVVSEGRQIISSEAKVPAHDGRVPAHGTSTIMVLAAR